KEKRKSIAESSRPIQSSLLMAEPNDEFRSGADAVFDSGIDLPCQLVDEDEAQAGGKLGFDSGGQADAVVRDAQRSLLAVPGESDPYRSAVAPRKGVLQGIGDQFVGDEGER